MPLTEMVSGAETDPKEHLGQSPARGSFAPPTHIPLSTNVTPGGETTSKNTFDVLGLQRTGKVYTETADREENGVKCGSNEPRPGSSAVERASYKRRVGGSTPLPATTPKTYYNENEPFVVEWLRRLVLFGLVAPGDVDDRSIEEVCADDLRPYSRCHFFAGLGLWDLSLQRAGWPDDREVWTGSCPCQPFSAAGQGRGFDDPRHLWPHWSLLIGERRPGSIFGEQVGDAAGRAWFDLVSADLEMAGYAVGAANLPAAGLGAPHIRQRLWFVAVSGQGRYGDTQNTLCARRKSSVSGGAVEHAEGQQAGLPRRPRQPGGALADTQVDGRRAGLRDPRSTGCGIDVSGDDSGPGLVGDGGAAGLPVRQRPALEGSGRGEAGRAAEQPGGSLGGRWADADWIWCRDGKYRPVEPGTFPLAHGYPARVGKLRAYGNAIVPDVAQAFIEAAMECAP